MGPQIIFRADASVAIGTGHIMRCLTLADALSAAGAQVEFACSAETLAIVPRLDASPYAIVSDDKGGDLLIIDHYGLGPEYERKARTRYHRVMVIDDLPERPHECDLLLDQTFGRIAEQWKPFVPSTTRVLAGTDYLLLRPEFVQTCPPRKTLKSILITLGGTDPNNATGIALDGIKRSGLDVAVNVVMGVQAPHLNAILTKAETMDKVRVHIDANCMADLMIHSDLAIGAGGTTAWERCCLGLPSIVLQIAANQRDVVQALTQAEAAVECALDANEIAATLRSIPKSLFHLSQCASRICTGDGTNRTAQAILTLLRVHP